MTKQFEADARLLAIAVERGDPTSLRNDGRMNLTVWRKVLSGSVEGMAVPQCWTRADRMCFLAAFAA